MRRLDKHRRPPTIEISRQLGMGTVLICMTLACILLTAYSTYGSGATVGTAAIFAFIAFHYCLGADEADQFAFAFIGFLCLLVVVVLLVFDPAASRYR